MAGQIRLPVIKASLASASCRPYGALRLRHASLQSCASTSHKQPPAAAATVLYSTLSAPRCQRCTLVRCASASEAKPPQAASASTKSLQPRWVPGTPFWAALAVCTGVLNRVSYKMALQPLGNYVFFLAQFQTFSYVLVYFTILGFRKRAGKVTTDMLAAPAKWRFGLIGACEAIAQVLGFLSASHLPGVVLPLLSQSIMFWQILLNKIVRNKVMLRIEFAGAATVVAGVICAAWPSGAGGSVFAQCQPLYLGVYLSSVFFPAVATVTKSAIFDEAKAKLGRPLDIFVVNSYSSAAQALSVFLMLPVLSSLRGIPPSQLPEYLSQGWACIRGLTPACGSNCAGAPQLAILYVANNLAFNIALLTLLRSAGNIALSLTLATVIPMTIFGFTLPLPYLAAAPPLGANFVLGTAILLAGLLTYNSPSWLPALKNRGSPMLTAPE